MRWHWLVASVALICVSCASDGDVSLEVASPKSGENAPFDHAHTAWTQLLSRNAKTSGLDYASVGKDRETFDRYLASLQGVSKAELGTWTREQRFAFWINVYNAYAVRLVVENYPVDSIKDLGGKPFGSVFDTKIVPLPALHPAGSNQKLSLNDVEHEILRARFTDARVHAAINCASVSCPPLLNEAFVADRLDEQLDLVMRRFVNSPSRNRLDRRARTLHLSKIFDWFQSDFARDAGSVPRFVARFAAGKSAGGDTAWISNARVTFLDYSWKLNDSPGR